MGFFEKFREKAHEIIDEVQEDFTGEDESDTLDETPVDTDENLAESDTLDGTDDALDEPSGDDDMYEKVVDEEETLDPVDGNEETVDDEEDIIGTSVGDANYDDPELNHEGLDPVVTTENDPVF